MQIFKLVQRTDSIRRRKGSPAKKIATEGTASKWYYTACNKLMLSTCAALSRIWCLFLTAPFHTLKIISARKVVVHWSSEECPASHFSLLKNFDRPSVFALHTHGSTKEFVRRRYIKQQDTSLNGRRGTLYPGDDADLSLSMGAFRTWDGRRKKCTLRRCSHETAISNPSSGVQN